VIWRLVCGLGILLLSARICVGQATPPDKGYAIAKRAEVLTEAYQDYVANGEMVIRTRAGKELKRRLILKARRTNNGNENLLVFLWPGDVRGTTLLTLGRPGRNDDQWLFLPDARLVTRINSASRSRSVGGGEFTYEDMVEHDLDDFSYVWLRDEACCHVVEARPNFSSAYLRQVVWYHIRTGLPVQVEYFPKRGPRLKVLSISGYRDFGGVWRPGHLHLENLQTGRSTELNWSEYRLNVGLRGSEFTARAIERGW
jgi:hypothetical protein